MRLLIMAVLAVVYLFKTYVALLNHEHSKRPLPRRISGIYDRERYAKWLAYSTEKNRLDLIQQAFNLVLLLILLSGPFARLEQFAAGQTEHLILQTLLFLGVYQAIAILLGIPFDLYRTFSIEERHGFNRTAPATFVRDLVLNIVLLAVLGGGLLAGVHALYLKLANNLWIFIFAAWAVVAVVMLMIFVFLNRLVLRLFNKFTPLPEGTLRTRIEQLAASLGFNIKSISVMDASRRSTKLNAFFSGIGKTKEVVLYDTLLEKASEDEVLAVLAHELGHAVYRDTLRMALFQIAAVGLYAAGVGLILQNAALFTAFGLSGVHFGFAIVLFTVLFQPVQLVLNLPFVAMMRKAEYRADRFAAKHTNRSWLISALKVLSRENLSNLNPHPLFVRLYYTHPPINDRIAALE
ncbi:MAG TPA: M48 family metallopeptidase [Firmicutes bacterium]|nr:M48 family metallopeptidase [Bacillota bacterium]